MKRVIAVVAVLASFSVFAQTEKPKQSQKPPAQNVTFGEDKMIGTTQGPGGTIILSAPKRVFNTLIVVRSSFQGELQESVNDLK